MVTDKFIAFALTLMIYIPGTSMGNYLRLGILLLSFIIVNGKKGGRFDPRIFNIVLCMVVSPFLPLIFVVLFEGTLVTSLLIHEAIRMVFCGVLILTAYRLEIEYSIIRICTLFAFLPNFGIQILQMIKFQPVFTFIREYYAAGVEGFSHLDLATYSGASFRSGSIFLNPNVYMAIPMVALCVFLLRDRKKPSLVNDLLIACTVVSGFLTGSRTAIIVMIVVLLYYLLRFASANRQIIFLVFIILAAWKFGPYIMENSRAVDFSETSSLEVKVNAYGWYLQRTASHPVYWLVGSIGSSLSGGMDAEWGYIFSWYGLFGLYWYIRYYKVLWNNNPNVVLFGKVITLVCTLISFTASVLLCMPIFSYIGTMALVQIKRE